MNWRSTGITATRTVPPTPRGRRELRARVTQDIYAQRCQQARAVAEQALIAQLGTHVTGPLPKQLVAGNYFAEQRQFNLRMQANKVNFDQYLKVQGQTVEEFRAWLHAEAERKLRSRMGLLLVAQREGFGQRKSRWRTSLPTGTQSGTGSTPSLPTTAAAG